MTNFQKFIFSDFTFKEYGDLLCNAKKTYAFITHKDFLEKKNLPPFLIWRHDIDMSVEKAIKFAEIENELNIKSTFFIHLHSEFYNFFERETFENIQKIKLLGHHIGLHFDSHFYNIQSETDLDFYIQKEKGIIENLFELKVDTFSFHNTNDFILSCKKLYYGELINTYASAFQEEIAYCSDSYGVWRYERLFDIIKHQKYNKLQVLTHPELWSNEVTSPYQRVIDCVFGRANKVKSMYDQLLVNNGREKIDW